MISKVAGNGRLTCFRLSRGVTDPRALAAIFEKAEAELARTQHPDPYRRKS